MEIKQPNFNDAGDAKSSRQVSDQAGVAASLKRARASAWLAESWERLWPRILPFVAITCLFLTVSWLGLWPAMLNEVRLVLLPLFTAAALLSLYPLRGFTPPPIRLHSANPVAWQRMQRALVSIERLARTARAGEPQLPIQ